MFVGCAMLTLSLASPVFAQRALLDKYCVSCHNEKLKTAGLMLDRADLTRIDENAPVLEKVVKKLRAGEMPPAGLPRPDKATQDSFVTTLEASLDDAVTLALEPRATGLQTRQLPEHIGNVSVFRTRS